MNKPYLCGKGVLTIVGSYHVALGLLLMTSGELAIRAARSIGGMTIAGSPELGIVGEVLACYLLAFGAMMLAAAWDPVKNRACISIGVVLFALRALQRAVFAQKTMSVFQMGPGHYWGTLAVVLVLGAALAVLRWRIYQDMQGAAPAS